MLHAQGVLERTPRAYTDSPRLIPPRLREGVAVERNNAEFTGRLQAPRDSLIVLQADAPLFASPSAGLCALKSTLTRVWGETVAVR